MGEKRNTVSRFESWQNKIAAEKKKMVDAQAKYEKAKAKLEKLKNNPPKPKASSLQVKVMMTNKDKFIQLLNEGDEEAICELLEASKPKTPKKDTSDKSNNSNKKIAQKEKEKEKTEEENSSPEEHPSETN